MVESVAVYTTDARCVYMNGATARLFGKSLAELRGRILWEVFPEAVGNPFYQVFQRVAASGHAERFEHYYPPFEQWFDNHIYLADERVWVIAWDVTERKRAQQQERAAAARLRVLSEVSGALAQASLDLAAVLDVITRQVVEHLGDACGIVLLASDGVHLEPVALHHQDPEALDCARRLLAAAPPRVGEGVSGRVIESGRSQLSAQVDPAVFVGSLKPELRPFAERFPVHSVLAVPLRARGRVIGSLQVTRHSPDRAYTEDDRALLEEVADRAALAIENARLHGQSMMQAQVLESMVEGVSVADEQGYILYTNPAEDRIFGYERGELVGKHVTIQNAYPPGENRRIVADVIAQLRAAGAWEGEFDNVRKDGTPFVTHAKITALDVADGRRWVCVQEDVTAERRARAERAALLADAERARHQLQFIVDAMPVLISYVDAGGHYRLNNLTYEKWFGRQRSELDGKHLREVLGEAAYGVIRPFVEQALAGVPVTYQRELQYLGAGTRWVESNYIPDVDAEGRVRGFVALVRDISDSKRDEEERRRRTEFEQQLIGIVSHDLRNPISVMLMAAMALLRYQETDPAITKGLRRIVASGELAARMIRDLLDFTQARIGGGIPIDRAAFDLHEHVAFVAEELQAANPGREVVVECDGDGVGEWDRDRISQLVTNLASNALTYSPERTPVTLRTAGRPDHVRLDVHNHGPPIDPETMSVLFEPFKRGRGHAGGSSRSIGLGLYIVKQLVLAHGGEIEARSEEGQGTTFSVRLPRR